MVSVQAHLVATILVSMAAHAAMADLMAVAWTAAEATAHVMMAAHAAMAGLTADAWTAAEATAHATMAAHAAAVLRPPVHQASR